ncbi:MAG: ATP-binding protein [Dorea sp.]|nr:ATP-binding protein [Dorea sp.]
MKARTEYGAKTKVMKPPHRIEQEIFRHQTVLILIMAFLLAVAGSMIMVVKEIKTDDQNLINIAESTARTRMFDETGDPEHMIKFFDSLKESLSNIDVISIVDQNGKRVYHSNHELIGTDYDGIIPDFNHISNSNKEGSKSYTESAIGPSGTQRRAYAAIYNPDGSYYGFVMAIMLRKNINVQIRNIILVFLMITLAAIFMEIYLSRRLSSGIKESLMGYEPDAFSAMFKIRDNILESIQEGIVAVDSEGKTRFCNEAAVEMLGMENVSAYATAALARTIESGQNEKNIQEQTVSGTPLIVDKISIMDDGKVAGAVALLHDRKEYTKLMEDLAGTRYLVDSMRANNHDFTNKLHVILGLIQMGKYPEAASYIENITLTRQEIISKIMHMVDEPTIAALLIGKTVKASEMNVKFIIQEGSSYHYQDYPLPQETLNTIIGNLIDNAYDAMNVEMDYNNRKELLFGIYSKPGVLLITVDDTGLGIAPENLERIFENGFSTKGENRGTGLYQSKQLIDALGGTITVDSLEGTGTSFTVTFKKG